MIEVRLASFVTGVVSIKTFHTKEGALRFMYKMKRMGHIILSYSCDDSWDNEWLNRRFKQ